MFDAWRRQTAQKTQDSASVYQRSDLHILKPTFDFVNSESCKRENQVTHCLKIVLHDVPVGLHHLKHHVVLDVLHKVEHALSEGERSGEPVHHVSV